MTDNVKVTKAMRLAEIKELLADNADIVAFCDKEIALIDSKAAKAKERATAKKDDVDELYDAVVAALSDEPITIADMTAKFDDDTISRSKIQYRLVKAVKNGAATKVDVTVDGKKAAAYVAA